MILVVMIDSCLEIGVKVGEVRPRQASLLMVAGHCAVEFLEAIDQHVGIEEPASAASGLQSSFVGLDFGPVASQRDRALDVIVRLHAYQIGQTRGPNQAAANARGETASR